MTTFTLKTNPSSIRRTVTMEESLEISVLIIESLHINLMISRDNYATRINILKLAIIHRFLAIIYIYTHTHTHTYYQATFESIENSYLTTVIKLVISGVWPASGGGWSTRLTASGGAMRRGVARPAAWRGITLVDGHAFTPMVGK